MSTASEPLSPEARYLRREYILAGCAGDTTKTDEYREAHRHALLLLRQTLPSVTAEEHRYRTRYFCGICYGEIPRTQEAVIRGDTQNRKAHPACAHLYYGVGIVKLRNQIASGTVVHDSSACYEVKYNHAACPIQRDGMPTMHPQPASWSEARS